MALVEICLAQRPDLIVCAGWMRVLCAAFIVALEVAGVEIIVSLQQGRVSGPSRASGLSRALIHLKLLLQHLYAALTVTSPESPPSACWKISRRKYDYPAYTAQIRTDEIQDAIHNAFNDFQQGKVDEEGNKITKTGVMIHVSSPHTLNHLSSHLS